MSNDVKYCKIIPKSDLSGLLYDAQHWRTDFHERNRTTCPETFTLHVARNLACGSLYQLGKSENCFYSYIIWCRYDEWRLSFSCAFKPQTGTEFNGLQLTCLLLEIYSKSTSFDYIYSGSCLQGFLPKMSLDSKHSFKNWCVAKEGCKGLATCTSTASISNHSFHFMRTTLSHIAAMKPVIRVGQQW